MTPFEAARDFHNDSPRATEQQAERYADDHFAESSDVREFMAKWNYMNDAAAKVRQIGFQMDMDRIMPD